MRMLAAVQAQRDAYRAKRRESDRRAVVAIVGYTNAGKSSLLNALCGADEVYADDLLFATLDPTTRLLCLPGGKEVLLSDTVGFIQKPSLAFPHLPSPSLAFPGAALRHGRLHPEAADEAGRGLPRDARRAHRRHARRARGRPSPEPEPEPEPEP